MPFPRPAATSGLRAVLYFNAGKAGWSERYFWTGHAARPGDFEADLAALVRARLQLLTEKTTLLGARLGPWPEGAAGTRLVLREPFAGVGLVIEDANGVAGPWESARVSAADSTRVYTREYAFRSLSRRSMVWDARAGGTLTPEGQAQAAGLFGVMRNDTPGSRQAGLWCILADVQDPAVTGRQRITRLAPAAPGCGTEVTTARPPAWKEGDTVKLLDMGKCAPRGMAGPALVLAVAGLVTTVAQEPTCCPSDYRAGPRATVELQTQALYAQASALPAGLASRPPQAAFRRVTWAPAPQVQPGCCAPVSTGVECLAVHPCGVVMDLLTVPYAARMRTFSGRDPSPVVWFDAPPGAAVYEGETVFRSRAYSGDLKAFGGVGEQVRTCWSSRCHGEILVGRACETRDGSAPAPYLGRTPCGPEDAWRSGGVPGVTPEIITDRAGRPPSCLPLSTPGGQREGGRQPAVGPGGEREGGVLHEGPTRQAGGEREGGVLHPGPAKTAGGEREGGNPPRTPPGGEREGGAHLVGPTTDRGGQREGGALRPGPGTSAGGEREGGAGHQAGPPESAGGEREGGRLPRVAPGGEREGGAPTHGPTTVAGGEREGGRLPRTPPGGEREGGAAPLLSRGGQSEGGRPAGTSAGGQSEGGRPPALAPGGESEGGRPPRVLPGGEREGGGAPPLARGGEREGGAHPVFTAGGESEGGPQPALGSGGQSEGGAPPALGTGGESEGGSIPRTPAGGQREGGRVPTVPPGGEREGGPVAAPGIQTACCPGTIPLALFASFSGGVTPAPVRLDWNPSTSRWESGLFSLCGTGGNVLLLKCVAATGLWELTCRFTPCVPFAGPVNPTALTCAPLSILFAGLSGTCCPGSFDINVTA